MPNRLAAGVLAVMVVATSGAAAGVAFICGMDGKVRSACCCPKGDAGRTGSCDRLGAPDAQCCSVQVSDVHQTTARLHDDAPLAPLPPAPPAHRTTPAALLVADVGASAHGSRGPPGPAGPPLFLDHCALLI